MKSSLTILSVAALVACVHSKDMKAVVTLIFTDIHSTQFGTEALLSSRLCLFLSRLLAMLRLQLEPISIGAMMIN